jgi:hypothetical protein
MRKAIWAGMLAVCGLMAAAPMARAEGANYTVTGKGDAPGAACVAAGSSSTFTCDSVRAALTAANGDVALDTIVLQTPGTYTLSQGPLAIDSNVVVAGLSPVNTTLKGNGTSRVLTVAVNMEAQLALLTVSGGTAGGGLGGNILTRGALALTNARVTQGTAGSGGGIASLAGFLTLNNSLVDHNTANGGNGGGILAEPDPDDSLSGSGSVLVFDSTIARNTVIGNGSGAGVASLANTSNHLELHAATVARNTVTGADGGAAGIVNDGVFEMTASLLAGNVTTGVAWNCGGTAPSEPQPGSVTDDLSCSVQQQGVGGMLLDSELSDQGGHTPVLAFPATSSLKGRANPCPVGIDQRGAARPATGPCDPGAYEQGAHADPVEPLDPGETPPPAATPTAAPVTAAASTPTPTPTATPQPDFHKDVVIRPVSGTVRVKLKGSSTFIDLASAKDIPLGSTIDVKAGRIQLSSVPKPGGTPQTATFYGGIFQITQPGGITDLKLNEALAACPKRAKASAAAKKKPKTRKLWGAGKGAFRTTGRYSAATVRGTEWLVQDSCSGTLTRVRRGVVGVRDNVRHKTVVIRGGHSYLAKPKH